MPQTAKVGLTGHLEWRLYGEYRSSLKRPADLREPRKTQKQLLDRPGYVNPG
jgi:hypothetical protein